MNLKEKVTKSLESFPKVKVVGDSNRNPWVAITERYYTLWEVNEWKEKLATILNGSEPKNPTPSIPSLYDVQACESLMDALNEVDPSVGQFWYGPITEMLSYFELPDRNCSECHKAMPFADYYVKQGMCDVCASKFSEGDLSDES